MANSLTNNNALLQDLLKTINELPSASGSGGAMETCTVSDTIYGIPEPAASKTFYYVDENGGFQIMEYELVYKGSYSFTTLKNSIVAVHTSNMYYEPSDTDSCKVLYAETSGALSGWYIFGVSGDCSL